jgi:hypothetical protein
MAIKLNLNQKVPFPHTSTNLTQIALTWTHYWLSLSRSASPPQFSVPLCLPLSRPASLSLSLSPTLALPLPLSRSCRNLVERRNPDGTLVLMSPGLMSAMEPHFSGRQLPGFISGTRVCCVCICFSLSLTLTRARSLCDKHISLVRTANRDNAAAEDVTAAGIPGQAAPSSSNHGSPPVKPRLAPPEPESMIDTFMYAPALPILAPTSLPNSLSHT